MADHGRERGVRRGPTAALSQHVASDRASDEEDAKGYESARPTADQLAARRATDGQDCLVIRATAPIGGE